MDTKLKDMCYNKIGLCAQNKYGHYFSINSEYNWKGQGDHSERIVNFDNCHILTLVLNLEISNM